MRCLFVVATLAAFRNTEFLAQRLEQFVDRQARIQDERNVEIVRDLVDQTANQRGFAGADFAGDQHEAAVGAQSVHQVRQRFAMTFAQIQETRIGRDRKRFLLESVVVVVHGRVRGFRSVRLAQFVDALVFVRPQLVDPRPQRLLSRPAQAPRAPRADRPAPACSDISTRTSRTLSRDELPERRWAIRIDDRHVEHLMDTLAERRDDVAESAGLRDQQIAVFRLLIAVLRRREAGSFHEIQHAGGPCLEVLRGASVSPPGRGVADSDRCASASRL